jgi:hypothetical protein
MLHDSKDQPQALADIWHAAEQQRTQEIGGWIKSFFTSKEPRVAPLSQPVSRGATARA